MNPTKERLQKKLSIIKILSKNQGITLENLAKYTNRTKQEITKDLGELFMVGAYPYTPADYLEIDFDGEKLRLNSPVSIEKSIGLTPNEWLALRNLIDHELERIQNSSDEKILQSIKEKIKKIVPYAEYKNYEKLREKIQQSIQSKKSIEFYYAGRKDEKPEKRKVDPWILFQEKNEYLAAFCHSRKGIRTFRLESISDLVTTNDPFLQDPAEKEIEKHLASFRDFLNTSSMGSDLTELLIRKSAFYNLSNQMEIQIIQDKYIHNNEEYILATTKLIHKGWFLNLVKSFGDSVIVRSPQELKNEIAMDLDTLAIPKILS
jgi:predicted DNA-binding transcriptional regulator YafY